MVDIAIKYIPPSGTGELTSGDPVTGINASAKRKNKPVPVKIEFFTYDKSEKCWSFNAAALSSDDTANEARREAFFFFLLGKVDNKTIRAIEHGDSITFEVKCKDGKWREIGTFTLNGDRSIKNFEAGDYWDEASEDRRNEWGERVLGNKKTGKTNKYSTAVSITVPESDTTEFSVTHSLTSLNPYRPFDVPANYRTAQTKSKYTTADYLARMEIVLKVLEDLKARIGSGLKLSDLTDEELQALADALEFINAAAELGEEVNLSKDLPVIREALELIAGALSGEGTAVQLTSDAIEKVIAALKTEKGNLVFGNARLIVNAPNDPKGIEAAKSILRSLGAGWVGLVKDIAGKLGIKTDATLDWFFSNKALRVAVAVEYLIKMGCSDEEIVKFILENLPADGAGRTLLAKYMAGSAKCEAILKALLEKAKSDPQLYTLILEILKVKNSGTLIFAVTSDSQIKIGGSITLSIPTLIALLPALSPNDIKALAKAIADSDKCETIVSALITNKAYSFALEILKAKGAEGALKIDAAATDSVTINGVKLNMPDFILLITNADPAAQKDLIAALAEDKAKCLVIVQALLAEKTKDKALLTLIISILTETYGKDSIIVLDVMDTAGTTRKARYFVIKTSGDPIYLKDDGTLVEVPSGKKISGDPDTEAYYTNLAKALYSKPEDVTVNIYGEIKSK
jgi:hypothetical protein